MPSPLLTLLATACLATAMTAAAADVTRGGVLRRHPGNPCWVTDDSGKAIFLSGSHTWATIQERGVEGVTADFDYPAYLEFMQRHGHNFLRLWTWEHATWMQFVPSTTPVRYKPLAYPRTGPGHARDGGLRFDVSRFDEAFFERLRARVIEAGRRGIYVSVMLFQGFSTEQKDAKELDPKMGDPWQGHPFHRDNNINGLDGDPDGDGRGLEVHTLAPREIVRRQEDYVRKVIDTLHGLDHVIWEIGNECHTSSIEWHYHMIRVIKAHEARGPKQRLVGMTGSPIENAAMLASPADWISPYSKDYLESPPVPDAKIIIVDTDHIAPWRADPLWVWTNFLRGNHFISMDGYRDFRFKSPPEPEPRWNGIRRAMGDAVRCAGRMNLDAMAPQGDLASTGYCLANPGREYLVLQPATGALEVSLPDQERTYAVEWLEVASGRRIGADRRTERGRTQFIPTFEGAAVLHLKSY